jgi:hypothetical protein
VRLCEADLRCLDAHAHLGNLVFDHAPEEAIRHCMQGFGLCLWRLGRFEEAHAVFDRMLWLNPSDNQGMRLLVGQARARRPWVDEDSNPA